MDGRILTCVYCGHEYPQNTPAHGSQVLTEDKVPAGCSCGQVLTGQIKSSECPLFGKACTPEKPVGTVWIGVATPRKSYAKLFTFSFTRERNIAKAASKAMEMLLEEVRENEK